MSSPPESLFEYTPLPEGDFIRLLHLYPNTSDAPLMARLEPVSLSQAPPYEALSYVWGVPAFDSRLQIINETRPQSIDNIFITKSLFDALSHLRQPPRNGQGPRILWADAVCINQKDTREKNTQIPLMRTIYSKAKRVIAYICPDPTRSVAAILRLPENQFRKLMAKDWDTYMGTLERSMKWLERTWIVQESLLARHLTIMLGSHAVKFTAYMSKMQLLSGFVPDLHIFAAVVMHRAAQDVRVHMNAYSMRTIDSEKPFHLELADLLATTRGTKCREPLDKVYALLGLCRETLGIVVDYNRSVTDVYIDVAHRILTIEGSLHLLCHAYRRTPGLQLPSYVPDWSIGEALYPGLPQTRLSTTPLRNSVAVRQYKKGIRLRCLSYGRLTTIEPFPSLSPSTITEPMPVENFFPISNFVMKFLRLCWPFPKEAEKLGRILQMTLGRTLIGMSLGGRTEEGWEDYFDLLTSVLTNKKPREARTCACYMKELATGSQKPWGSKMWLSDTGFIGNGCEKSRSWGPNHYSFRRVYTAPRATCWTEEHRSE